ncbi:electron transfer flavoprotein subunit beta/FixA family protein [Arthrobacter sp. StoSoilB5]|jgi:electron transfer flavoprotein beta subunit|uniref:electron transfer flavoprotein subunit beta/FixA family protein n=1 Tax=Arthrobacter sp. StoSoilB5 TaxID=2830992 RepID=UPI001CC3D376|nr:electron transfer flavoprotein subunit beta/FixA family protein [Arthrobacter sp. StoSoilB5]BCW45113.1 electron transfer flavoprotein subunit beta [Arthrobacter sp. StoSoilB5]
MKIVVLVKQVPDTEEERMIAPDGNLDRKSASGVADEINERALEVALSFKDANKGTEVVLLSMGPAETAAALRKGLQMGADSAVHVKDDRLSGADAVQTAHVLAAALQATGFDVVIAGNASTDGGGGIVPAMISELLGVPLLGSLNQVTLTADSVAGERQEENGTAMVQASLPAVFSVTERAAEARFPNFKGILTAKRKTVRDLMLDDLRVPQEVLRARSTVLSVQGRPARAIGSKIVDDGNAGRRLAEFLVSSRLV